MKIWKTVLTCLCCGAVLSCSTPEQKYKVLSFFFDGVPRPAGLEQEAGAPAAGPGQPIQKAVPQIFEHGPYAAKYCEGCHVRGSNRLIMPKEQLCNVCHTLGTEKRYVHGPVNSGDCMICHDPHVSAYRYLLISDETDFCFYCHEKNDVYAREVHNDHKALCTQCHDPHMSDNEYLLK